MKNLYICGVLSFASLNASCGGRILHKPVQISCDAGFNTSSLQTDPIAFDQELARTCASVAGRFRHLIDQLQIGKPVHERKNMKAVYQPGQIVFYDTSNAETTCRHELIHAACDIGGYRLNNKVKAFQLMKQLFLNEHLREIRFEDYLNTIDSIGSRLDLRLQDFMKSHPDFSITDFKTKMTQEHAMISKIMQQFADLIAEGHFKDFKEWKLIVLRFYKNIQRAVDMLENQKLIIQLLDKKSPKLHGMEALVQMQQLLFDMRYRMLQCFDPEEILAHAFESTKPSVEELALRKLLQRF